MSVLDYINKMKEMYEGERIMTQEPRNMYSDGQLVQNTVDGSRPGYGGKDEYSRLMQLSLKELKEMGYTGDVKFKKVQVRPGVKESRMVPELKDFIKEQTAASPKYRIKDIKFKPRELRVVNAIKKAFEKNDVRYIVSRDNLNKIGNFKYNDYPIITAMKKDSGKLKLISDQTGIAEKDLLNLLEDRKVYIDNKYSDKNRQAWADERTKPKRKFYASAEKWILRNSKRYADPEKFYNAFIRTFGKDNHFIKSIEAGKTTGFKVAFSDEFVDGVLGLKHKTSVNSKQLKDVFKTSIYTNNPNVKKRILDTFNDIIPKDIKYISNLDVRAALIENPLLQKFGINQAIRGPIAKLLADDLIDSIGISLDDISAFRKPWLGTRQLITYLATRVDPKYKSMFEEAGKAVAHAQVNEWSKAKKALNISQNIMFDHKIPQALIKMGFADDLDYIRVTPTLADFNTKVKLFEFDQPMITLANEFKRKGTTDARKLEIYEQMLDTKNKFNSKYGNYLGNMDITYNQKTGKLKLTNVDPILTKKTDLVAELKKNLNITNTDNAATITRKIKKTPMPSKLKGVLMGVISAGGAITGADFLKRSGILFDKEFEQTASAVDAPIVEKGLSTAEKAAIGGASSLVIPAVRKAAGTALNLGFAPTGALALTYGLRPEGGYDLSKAGDRTTFEIEAAFANPLVKGAVSVTDKIKNPMLRKIAERGSLALMSPAMALRAARVATPLGIASLAGEGLYSVAKHSKPNYYIDPKTQEPTFYDRENASDVLPTMMGIYDQAYNIAKKENISYQEALNKINPERFYNLKKASGGRAGYMGGGMAGIRKPSAIPPERQGLRSIMINGKKY